MKVVKPICTNEELTVISSEKSDLAIVKKAFTSKTGDSEISEKVPSEMYEVSEGNLLKEIHQQN
jgi:hypothetical protein